MLPLNFSVLQTCLSDSGPFITFSALSAPFSFSTIHFYSFRFFLPRSLPQVAALQEEKSSLLAENQVLMERLNQSDSIEDINSPAGRRHLQLQTQLEQLQEETFRCGAVGMNILNIL